MTEMFNCPNCGAPITSDRCIYCGTTFIDWTAIDTRKPNWIKIKHNGHIILIKAALLSVTENYMPLEPEYFCDSYNQTVAMPSLPSMTVDATLECLPFKPIGLKKATNALWIDIDSNKENLQEIGEMLHNTIEGEDYGY